MANEFAPNQAATFSGTGTYACTLGVAGPYTLEFKSTLPLSSGLQVVMKHNNTTLATIGGSSQNPSPTQQSFGSSATFQAAVGDTASIVVTSSAAADAVPNNVKTYVNCFLGPQ